MAQITNLLGAHFTSESPSSGRRRWHNRKRRKKLRLTFLFVLVSTFIAITGIAFAYKSVQPAVGLLTAGNTIIVKRDANFQAALNQAKAGDTIILEAGAEFVGSFELPVKTGDQFITIQSSALAELPGENVRVTPANSELMPKIVSPGKGESAIKTAPGAARYRFIGIELTTNPNDYIYNLIYLGADAENIEDLPKQFEFDRCYVHSPGLNKARRGFALNGGDTTIKNSYVSGFAGASDETQAIVGWAGAGPYKIFNNYLEGGAQTIMFGGNDPSIANLVPSDIEIRGNHISKPVEWRGKATMKNTIELKNARRVQIVGNIIENCWDCTILGFTVRNQDGTAPWSTIEDVTVQNNILRRGSAAINLLGRDNINESQRMKRVKIVNNLILDVDSAKWGSNSGGGYFVQMTDTEDLEIAHNSVVEINGNILTAYGDPNTRFNFRNNIVLFNDYGFWREHEDIWANGAILNNVVINNKADLYFNVPEHNFAVDNFSQVGFADWKTGDYKLLPNSRFKSKGENGRDIGCDIDAINKALAAVKSRR